MSYSIVFTGKIRQGATLPETRSNLAEMFKITNEALLDKVFSGKSVILKKGLSEDERAAREMILLMAGAVCDAQRRAAALAPCSGGGNPACCRASGPAGRPSAAT